MTKEQVIYIMQGREISDIDQISLTSNSKIYPFRSDVSSLVFDNTNELLDVTYTTGKREFWDYVDINGICFK